MVPEWRGHIQKRPDGSERVNYNNPHFPTFAYLGSVFAGCSWEKDAHFHDDIEMIAMTTGDVDYSINGEQIHIHEGDCLFINSKQIHYSIGIHPEKSWYSIYIFHPNIMYSSYEVEHKFIRPIIENTSIPYIIFRKEEADTKKLFDYMLSLPECSGNEFLITLTTFEMWKIIMRRCQQSMTQFKSNSVDSSMNTLKMMMTYMQNHYSETITLEDIANAGHVSKTYCNQLFHKYTNQTPIENLTKLRLSIACDLLMETNQSMSEIAEASGFSSASYLTEKFKQFYGVSPREYKKKPVV